MSFLCTNLLFINEKLFWVHYSHLMIKRKAMKGSGGNVKCWTIFTLFFSGYFLKHFVLLNFLSSQWCEFYFDHLNQRRPTQMRSRAAFIQNSLIKGQIFGYFQGFCWFSLKITSFWESRKAAEKTFKGAAGRPTLI
jgi:hypothetical protein